jgi:hypothetical protein
LANYGKKTRLDLNKRQVSLIIGSLDVMRHETWDEELQLEITQLINVVNSRSEGNRQPMSSLWTNALKQNRKSTTSHSTSTTEEATDTPTEARSQNHKRAYKKRKTAKKAKSQTNKK